MGHSTGSHTKFHHRYHLVWSPKYRFKVLHGEVRLRVSEIIRQVCGELGKHIRKRYWGQLFWQRGYFSTTSGNITDDLINNYLNEHDAKDGFIPSTLSY